MLGFLTVRVVQIGWSQTHAHNEAECVDLVPVLVRRAVGSCETKLQRSVLRCWCGPSLATPRIRRLPRRSGSRVRFQPVLQAGHHVLNVHVYEGRAKASRHDSNEEETATERRRDSATAAVGVKTSGRCATHIMPSHLYAYCLLYTSPSPRD